MKNTKTAIAMFTLAIAQIVNAQTYSIEEDSGWFSEQITLKKTTTRREPAYYEDRIEDYSIRGIHTYGCGCWIEAKTVKYVDEIKFKPFEEGLAPRRFDNLMNLRVKQIWVPEFFHSNNHIFIIETGSFFYVFRNKSTVVRVMSNGYLVRRIKK